MFLEGRGIGRIYGEGELASRALEPCDVAIDRGELVVIIGPSGSGKTTLLSMLGLVLVPSEGEVFLGGRPVSFGDRDVLAELRLRHLGFVFQQFNLIQALTAAENVELPLLLAGETRRSGRGRALAALEQVGLAEKAGHKPRALSGGQQQRVALARALAADPAILLCDEPTASLDAASGRTVLELLERLAHETNRGVGIVTHDERVLSIADRVVEVHEGRVRS